MPVFSRAIPHVLLTIAISYNATGPTAQVASPSFVTGSAEDEAAIRKVLAQKRALTEEHRAPDIDWENAFGVRFDNREKLDAFTNKQLAPTLASAATATLEVKIRFLEPSLAIADMYSRTAGQVETATGKSLPDRWVRVTSILKKTDGSWSEILLRIADLRQPWYEHFSSLPKPVSIPAPTLAQYAGTYEASPGALYEISVDGSYLAVKTVSGTGIAIPRSDNEFLYFRDRSVPGNYTFVRFLKSLDGTMTFTESGPGNDHPLSLKKIR